MRLPTTHLSTTGESAQSFADKFAEYSAARDAHALTEGVPAPWPEHEIFRAMYESGHRSVSFDARELALLEIARKEELRAAALQRLHEDTLIVRAAREPGASDELKALAAAMPPEVLAEVKRHDDLADVLAQTHAAVAEVSAKVGA